MISDFEETKRIEITELKSTLVELIHKPSGANVMHIANDDPENLFCLSFRTIPEKSDGVAHILEHTVLCGSDKFPVKDPFYGMQRRSLNTFMNAMTGADFTCYPAATQVPKDFYNLLEVYMDAVFHPRILELSFLQEGHRLEFADKELTYKGIVFNEMKGALSSPDSRLIEAINEALYPNITYGVNSGGDPKVIPELTYEQLLAFHAKYYHPSRCLFFFYGNMPLEKHLTFLEENCLKGVEKLKPIAPIEKQKRFTKQKKLVVPYPMTDNDGDDKAIVAHAYLTCHILEQQELLALSLLETLLMCTDASPLKYALLSSGLCKQAGAYIDEDISEVPWVLVMKGCKEKDTAALKEVATKALEKIVEEGIPAHLVDSALHQLEFQRTEITGDGAPFGLSLFMRAALLRQHGGDAENALVIHKLFDALRHKIESDPKYLPGLIKKHLLDNPHFVEVVMTPDTGLEKKEVAEEKAKLQAINEQLSEKAKAKIVDTAAKLEAFQLEQEGADLEVLPKVTLKDVPKETHDYPLTQETVGNTTLFHHDTFTNNITYMDWVYDLPATKEEEMPLVRLFTMLLPQVGCGGRTYMENLDYIQENTGGIGVALGMNIQADDHKVFQPTIQLRGKALSRKSDKLFPLIHDMIVSADFTDKARLKELIRKHHSGLESGLTSRAMRYAINLSASGVSLPSHISNLWHGIKYLLFIREIAKDFDNKADALIERMEQMQNSLLCLENPHLVITCTKKQYDLMKKENFYGLLDTPQKKAEPFSPTFAHSTTEPQGRTISSPVAFTAKVFPTVSFTDKRAPYLSLAAHLFDNKTLHPKIREQGGAYGGGAVSNTSSGLFYFYAYRDPNITSTLRAFDDSIASVAKGDFTDTDLEEAKLEMIQAIDTPIAPGSRGDTAYSWWREGKSVKVRQTFRDTLLKASREDIIEVTKELISVQAKKGSPVVFAGRELLEKENDSLTKPLKIEAI